LLTPEAGGKRFVAASPEPFSYEYAADIIRDEFNWGSITVSLKGRYFTPNSRDTVSPSIP
jgi:hypothetical protein